MAKKDELIRQLADKYKISVAETRKAVESQFKFTSKAMQEDDYPSIRLPFFGIFKPKKGVIKNLKKKGKNE